MKKVMNIVDIIGSITIMCLVVASIGGMIVLSFAKFGELIFGTFGYAIGALVGLIVLYSLVEFILKKEIFKNILKD